jgi:hypothetical protein
MRTKPKVICLLRHYEPDLARQTQALRAVLRLREIPQHTHDGTVEERETETTRSNAPGGLPSGAPIDTDTAGHSVAKKEGSPHEDTTRRPS